MLRPPIPYERIEQRTPSTSNRRSARCCSLPVALMITAELSPKLGVSCLGPVDHGFVKSVYMYDPNGLQVELTVRTAEHEQAFASGALCARQEIEAWHARTRAEKLERLGEATIDRRSRRPR